MIFYPCIDIPLLIIAGCFIFTVAYLLGTVERKSNRDKDYWRGYTDCMNEDKPQSKNKEGKP